MTIEIYTPQNEVPEHIVFYLKGKLMDLCFKRHQGEKTEVVLKHQQINGNTQYVCEVTLHLYGETILIHRSHDSYLQAIREVIKEISKIMDRFFESRNELPDIIATTVSV